MKSCVLTILIIAAAIAGAQGQVPAMGGDDPVLLSPKPRISVNDVQCHIMYEEHTCSPKVCDSVFILAGDAINFCTISPFVNLNDPDYYIEWNFTGSDIPQHIDTAYTPVPVCHDPVWNTPGDYTVNIYYYNGLSVCCCNLQPSHWNVPVQVQPLVGMNELIEDKLFELYPVPAVSEINILFKSGNAGSLQIFDSSGRQVYFSDLDESRSIDISSYARGLYLFRVFDAARNNYYTERVVIN
jgi:hypothetical protein